MPQHLPDPTASDLSVQHLSIFLTAGLIQGRVLHHTYRILEYLLESLPLMTCFGKTFGDFSLVITAV